MAAVLATDCRHAAAGVVETAVSTVRQTAWEAAYNRAGFVEIDADRMSRRRNLMLMGCDYQSLVASCRALGRALNELVTLDEAESATPPPWVRAWLQPWRRR